VRVLILRQLPPLRNRRWYRRNSVSNKEYVVVGLGELLWDLFPAGKQMGGAPANFAYITSLLGDEGLPASSLGMDDLGDEAVRRLDVLKLPTEFVQRDTKHPTGTVKVRVDTAGQPCFEISENVAWDFLDWTPEWQDLAKRTDAVCFSTLAQRAEQSCNTMRNFLRATRRDALRVCDINLRQHFFTKQVVDESMKLANVVKLNHEELPRVMKLFGWEHPSQEDSARRLLEAYELDLICITRGNHGSLLMSREEVGEHPGFQVRVADTVGAGDAFTATLVHGYLRGHSLARINERANRVGAWVASQAGGTPAPDAGDVEGTLARIA
jgi:fructokinase